MTPAFIFYLFKLQFLGAMVISKDTKNTCTTFNAKYAMVMNTHYIR